MTRYTLFLLTALLAPAWAQDEPPVALLPVLGDLGFANTTFSDADFGVVGIALGWLGSHAGRFAITALVIGIVAALVAYNYAVLAKAKVADKK